MQILTASQIRQWDEYTIEKEPISSRMLMERAAARCTEFLVKAYPNQPFYIFCGKGNNGGDGLAIARMLHLQEREVTVFILEFGHLGTNDFQENLVSLHELKIDTRFIPQVENIPPIPEEIILIDALLGTGLNRSVDGLTAKLIQHLNKSGNEILSIDIPSGLPADSLPENGAIIQAKHTLTFQILKRSFLFPESERYTGKVHVLNIELDPEFLLHLNGDEFLLTPDHVKSIFQPRKLYSHKGSFGHALLVAGSYGKIGAAVLASKACLRSGCGLTTVFTPACGTSILQISNPEAMTISDENDRMIVGNIEDLARYQAIGIGPGIGMDDRTGEAIFAMISKYSGKTILDADALNLIAQFNALNILKPGTIITPHPKEFERLFGKTANSMEAFDLARKKSQELALIIILKGRNTSIHFPSGKAYFNTTGNPGMATGGTGDVLTGIIVSLLAQNYEPEEASLLGVYMHGLAADFAVEQSSEESMLASDITQHLGKAFRTLYP